MGLIEVYPRTLCASYGDDPSLFAAASLRLVDPLQRDKSSLLVLRILYISRRAVDLVEGLVDLMVPQLFACGGDLLICILAGDCITVLLWVALRRVAFWPIAGENNE